MPQDNTSRLTSSNPALHKGIAIFFGISGLVCYIPLLGFLWLMANWSGWGDGATGNAIQNPMGTAFLFSLPVLTFFITSITASVSSSKLNRTILAGVALLSYIAISGVVLFWSLKNELLPVLLLIILSIPFIWCWVQLLKNQAAEQGSAHQSTTRSETKSE